MALIEDCNECHHVYEDGEKLEDESSEDSSCSECHEEKGSGCKGCHHENKKGPIMCGQCHVR
jgi:hypothetical protein